MNALQKDKAACVSRVTGSSGLGCPGASGNSSKRTRSVESPQGQTHCREGQPTWKGSPKVGAVVWRVFQPLQVYLPMAVSFWLLHPLTMKGSEPSSEPRGVAGRWPSSLNVKEGVQPWRRKECAVLQGPTFTAPQALKELVFPHRASLIGQTFHCFFFQLVH